MIVLCVLIVAIAVSVGWTLRLLQRHAVARMAHQLELARQQDLSDGAAHRRWEETRRLEHQLAEPADPALAQLRAETNLRQAEADAASTQRALLETEDRFDRRRRVK